MCGSVGGGWLLVAALSNALSAGVCGCTSGGTLPPAAASTSLSASDCFGSGWKPKEDPRDSDRCSKSPTAES